MADFNPGNPLHVSIVSPAKEFYEGEAISLQIPTVDGLIGILPGHVSLLSLLGFGLLTVKSAEGVNRVVVDGGFLEVKNNRVTVLANSAENLESVNREKAQANFDEAMKMKASGEFQAKLREEKLAAARTRLRYATGN